MKTTSTTQMFNHDELRALLDLIEFHDDWEELNEILGVDVEKLYEKVHDLFAL